MIFVLIALIVFLADLMAKKYVEANLKDGEEKKILGGRVEVRKVHNRGFALGFLHKKPEVVKNLTSLVLVCFAIRALVGKKNGAEKTGYALLLGGSLSNWYDRFHQGWVTDYLHVPTRLSGKNKVFFNLGDCAIFLGGLLTCFHTSREKKTTDQRNEE